MANLSITARCSRDCGYCFARPVFEALPGAAADMSRRTFLDALEFLARSDIDQVRLLGGEPTLHPDFNWMTDRVLERGMRLLVFSNGLMPQAALDHLAGMDADRAAVLVNVTPVGGEEPGEGARRDEVFGRLGRRVTVGYNIASPAPQPGFLLDLIERFDLARCVRLGLAHPEMGGRNAFLNPRYYTAVGERLLSFADDAVQADVELEFDCGFVPCMFAGADTSVLGAAADGLGRRCAPIPDVLPDGTVIACYGLAGYSRETLPVERDASWLNAGFRARLAPWRAVHLFPECRGCPLLAGGQCVGGCLAAALQRVQRASFELQAPSSSRRPRSRLPVSGQSAPQAKRHQVQERCWVVPYVDQPISFWEQLHGEFAAHVLEVYFPLSSDILGSGRPVQPAEHLDEYLRRSPFPHSVLVNPVVLPVPVHEVAGAVVDELKRLHDTFGLAGATVSNLALAERVRQELPHLSLTASTLMDISRPHQALMLNGVFDALAPASCIMRDLDALTSLRQAFRGRIRLIVNEGCLPGCPFRTQHFLEMGSRTPAPRSLCDGLLARMPWLRLTGAWVLPQHLHLYDGLWDQLKLAGRVTLQDPVLYKDVLAAYVLRRPRTPDSIGGGPASPLVPLPITQEFYAHTLRCERRCHKCRDCRDYYETMLPQADW